MLGCMCRRGHDDDLLGAEGQRCGEQVMAEFGDGIEQTAAARWRAGPRPSRASVAISGRRGLIVQTAGSGACRRLWRRCRAGCCRRPMMSLRCREGIAHGAGRADGGAVAAARADRRVDGDMIADRRDGAGRADVEAFAAADLLAAGVGADAGVVADIERLLEFADEIRGFKQARAMAAGFGRIGAEVAVAAGCASANRAVPPDMSRMMSQVERAPLRAARTRGRARGGQHRRIAVDLDLEGAETAGRLADAALGDGAGAGRRRERVAGIGEQHGDAQAVGQLGCGVECDLAVAVDEADAARFECRRGGRLADVCASASSAAIFGVAEAFVATIRRARGCW